MPRAEKILEKGCPCVVGSFGSAHSLLQSSLPSVTRQCAIAEIRMDILERDGSGPDGVPWSHLRAFPLLFTARRLEEGGAVELSAARRADLIRSSLEDAAWVDIEVASIAEMQPLLDELRARGIPWIASYHDFEKLPSSRELSEAARRAKDAGAHVFKAAARVSTPADLAQLAEFQLSDQGILLATMGMGSLAPISRLLCAHSGSVLNYGYLGEQPTAPGQWDSAFLQEAIARLR